MKRINVNYFTNIECNDSYEALPLEYELEKAVRDKTPIVSISPELFFNRKDGVRPETDIRVDKWDIAHEAMDKVSQARIAKLTGIDKTENSDLKQKSEKVSEKSTSSTENITSKTGSE